MRVNEPITNREIDLPDGEPLVSRTDLGGRIVFANKAFLDVSGYSHEDLIGAPHNIVRHPHMPQAAFADLWATIKAGTPWEGLVKNRAKNGDFYWVRANVTPVMEGRAITGYISIRSKPTRQQIGGAEAAYALLRDGRGKGFGLRNGLLVRRGWQEWCRTSWASVTGRLAITLSVAVLTIFLTAWFGLQGMNGSDEALGRVYAGSAVEVARIAEVRDLMRGNLQQATLLTLDLQPGKKPGAPQDRIKAIQANVSRIDALIGSYTASALSQEQRDLTSRFVEQRAAFVRDGLGPLMTLEQQGDTAALNEHLYGKIVPLQASADATIGRLVEMQTRRAEAALAGARDDIRFRFRTELAVVLVCGAAVVAAGGLLFRAIRQPLHQLGTSAEAMARDDFTRDISIPAQREFWQLVGLLRALRAKLTYTAHERKENERLAGIDRRKAVREMADTVEREAGQVVERVAVDTGDMARKAEGVAELTERVSENALGVSAAADQALANAQAVGAASEQLSASIQEIASQIARSTDVSRSAVHSAERAQQGIQSLSQAAVRIGDVVQLIRTIAKQTNLLALNATIEAARAGPAGRGFTVVASEVKGLAAQTARSTEEISRQVAAIQDATSNAVDVVAEVGQAIQEISHVTTSIAAAMEEQAAATQEIARNVTQSSAAMQDVAEQITDVSRDAGVSRLSADHIRQGSAAITASISELRGSIVHTIRTATHDADRRMETRTPVDELCTVEINGAQHQARLLDISQGGGRLTMEEKVPSGARGILALGARGSGLDATAPFEVRSIHPDGSMGVLFDEAKVSPGFTRGVALLTAAKQSGPLDRSDSVRRPRSRPDTLWDRSRVPLVLSTLRLKKPASGQGGQSRSGMRSSSASATESNSIARPTIGCTTIPSQERHTIQRRKPVWRANSPTISSYSSRPAAQSSSISMRSS